MVHKSAGHVQSCSSRKILQWSFNSRGRCRASRYGQGLSWTGLLAAVDFSREESRAVTKDASDDSSEEEGDAEAISFWALSTFVLTFGRECGMWMRVAGGR